MNIEDRLNHINHAMQAIQTGWPFFLAELDAAIQTKTESLISQNSEETRGAIKALRELKNLPEALQHEREALTAALSDEDAALYQTGTIGNY
jgi:DNA anti-recombination protein RmuC